MIAAEPTVRMRVRRGHELARMRGAERRERARPTLDAVISSAWRRLAAEGRIACLICGDGELSGLRGCSGCGSHLS